MYSESAFEFPPIDADLYRLIVETAQEGIWTIDQQGLTTFVNSRMAAMLGYEREEMLGKHLFYFMDEEQQAIAANNMQRRRSGIREQHDFQFQHKNGEPVYALLETGPLYTAGGEYIGALAMVADITERKKAHQALVEQDARLKQAMHIAKLGLWEWDVATDRTTWAGDMFRIYGISPQAFTGRGEDYLDFTHPDDRALQRENIRLAFDKAAAASAKSAGEEGEETRVSIDPKEFRIVRPDDSECIVLGDAVAVVDHKGRPLRMIGTLLDITDRRLAERELRRHREDLERIVAERTNQLTRANAELESFSYSVSHDLRAPLRSIDGFSAIIVEECGDHLSAKAQDCIGRVRAAAQRMGRLIDEMLELSRVARIEPRMIAIDVSALAKEIVEEIASASDGRQVEVAIQDELAAHGDAQLLRRLPQNLLENAWKYTSKKEHPRIWVGSERYPWGEVFFVQDNGAGFDMAYAKQLFGLFQRLHAVDEFPGTGVGLANAKRIVEKHHGAIWAKGEVGVGATFYFTLGHTPPR